MYYDYNGMEKYGQRTDATKPLIQCEYAHAMGNSLGGLDHYWELVRKYPSYQGGFIWDFVDQGLARYEPDGRVSFLYGGDFNDYDATDNSFNCNGIIAPDRTWHPHAYEVQRQYQSIWTTPVDLARGRVEVYNENFFIGLDAYEMEWQLLADGRVVKAGRIGDLDVAPQQRRAYTLGFTAADFCPQAKEILVNVAYKLKEKQPLLDIGHTAARQQFVVREYDCKAGFGLAASARPVEVTRWERGARVEGDTWQVFFSRDGFLAAYTVDGRELMAEGAEMPDLIIADGGKGQMGVIHEVLERLGLDIPIAGLAKDDRHRTAELLCGFPPVLVGIRPTSPLFHFLAHIQEEVHRFAVSFHRQKRSKAFIHSELEQIEGVGDKTVQTLLRHFRTVEKVRAANIEELSALVGAAKAKKIRAFFEK